MNHFDQIYKPAPIELVEPGMRRGHGGLRRRHVPPKFNFQEAEQIRAEHAAGASTKELCHKYSVYRKTLYMVLNREGAYK